MRSRLPKRPVGRTANASPTPQVRGQHRQAVHPVAASSRRKRGRPTADVQAIGTGSIADIRPVWQRQGRPLVKASTGARKKGSPPVRHADHSGVVPCVQTPPPPYVGTFCVMCRHADQMLTSMDTTNACGILVHWAICVISTVVPTAALYSGAPRMFSACTGSRVHLTPSREHQPGWQSTASFAAAYRLGLLAIRH